jgi:hypothetical protein
MGRATLVVLTIVCLLSMPAMAGQTPPSAGAKGVYVVGFRTPGHVMSSSAQVFHSALADVRKLLEDNNIDVVADPERGFIETESQISVESMTKLAQEAGAAALLQVTVDRPTTKWIKLILRSYDLSGKLLWEEKVDGGMGGMSGAGGYKKCFEKLGKLLAARVGGPGLLKSDSVPVGEPKLEKTS